MKIIYFSDNYAYDVMGTKGSIAEEVSKRGYNVLVIDKKQINKILDIIKLHNPDQVWLVHSWLSIPKNLRKRVRSSAETTKSEGLNPNFSSRKNA